MLTLLLHRTSITTCRQQRTYIVQWNDARFSEFVILRFWFSCRVRNATKIHNYFLLIFSVTKCTTLEQYLIIRLHHSTDVAYCLQTE